MRYTALKPIIRTDRFSETLEFYTKVLSFDIRAVSEDHSWASLEKDDVEIMLSVPNAHLPFEKAVFTGSFYFYTDDVEGLWACLKNRVRICYDLEVFEWGMKEFAVYDNNGYLLQFGQSMV